MGIGFRKQSDSHSGVFPIENVLNRGCLRNCGPESAGGGQVADPQFPGNGKFFKDFSPLDSQLPLWPELAWMGRPLANIC